MAGQNAQEIFAQDIPARLAAKPLLSKEVNACYEFKLAGNDGEPQRWIVDLREAGGGAIRQLEKDEEFKADCVVSLSEALFVDIVNKKSSAQMAVMTGKLKLSNMGLALKLTKIL